MKKYLSLLAIMALIACTSEEDRAITSSLDNSTLKRSTIRSFDEALQIAQNSISLLDGKAATRGTKSRSIDLSANKIVKGKGTRASALDNDTLMYVFNFEDNQGFAVVAAPLGVSPLLAVTESGSYDPSNLGDNEAFNQYMELAEDYLGNHPSRLDPGPVLLYFDEVITYFEQKGPFLSVIWGQAYPEGEYCPNGVAGCANTAIAQIMSYYGYPASISLTYYDADISTQTLNWTQMKAHQTGHSLSSCSTQDIHKSIGRLHRQLGKMNASVYHGNGETSTATSIIPTTMSALNYTVSDWVSYDTTYIASKLANEQPLLFKAGNHVWVIDGYDLTKTVVNCYERVSPLINEYVLVSSTEHPVYLYHFNWGWYGDCNGYFSPNVFNSQGASRYDGTHETAFSGTTGASTLLFYPSN